MVPVDPTFASSKPDFSRATLYLTGFSLQNLTSADNKDGDKTGSMARQFIAYVESRNKFYRVVDARSNPLLVDKSAPYLAMDVRVLPDHTEHRTIILDALFYYPFVGYFPFTPQWGKCKLEVSIQLYDGMNEVAAKTASGSKGYVIWFYPYYNKTAIDATFKDLYRSVFEQACAMISEAKPEISVSIERQAIAFSAGVAAGTAVAATAPAPRSRAKREATVMVRARGKARSGDVFLVYYDEDTRSRIALRKTPDASGASSFILPVDEEGISSIFAIRCGEAPAPGERLLGFRTVPASMIESAETAATTIETDGSTLSNPDGPLELLALPVSGVSAGQLKGEVLLAKSRYPLK